MVHMTFLTRCQAGRIHQILREFARHPGSPVVTKNWNNKNHPKNKYINTDTIVLSHLPIPQLIIGWPSFFLERYQEFLVILIIRGFLKNAGFPQQPLVFPSKNDHFGVVWGGLGVPPFKETPIYSYEIWIFPPSPWTPRFFFPWNISTLRGWSWPVASSNVAFVLKHCDLDPLKDGRIWRKQLAVIYFCCSRVGMVGRMRIVRWQLFRYISLIYLVHAIMYHVYDMFMVFFWRWNVCNIYPWYI